MTWPWARPDALASEREVTAAATSTLNDLSRLLQVREEEVAALRASLVERTHERDTAQRAAEAAEAKFTFCADALAAERLRNKELLDRLMALTDRRSLQVLRGEVAPAAPVETEAPRPLRAPVQGMAGQFDPSKVDIEALFRMPD